MDISVHFNAPLTIGLCLLPGAFILAFLMLFLFQCWDSPVRLPHRRSGPDRAGHRIR
jgi:hypothetical protein